MVLRPRNLVPGISFLSFFMFHTRRREEAVLILDTAVDENRKYIIDRVARFPTRLPYVRSTRGNLIFDGLFLPCLLIYFLWSSSVCVSRSSSIFSSCCFVCVVQ